MDLTLIAAASQSLGVIRALADGLVSVRDETKLAEVKIELLRQVINVMQSMQALQQEHQRQLDINLETKKDADELKRRLAEQESLTLYDVWQGSYVYAAGCDSNGDPEPPYFCQNCRDKQTKSVLRHQAATQYEPAYLRCVEEPRHSIQLGPDKRLPTPNVHTRRI